MSAEKLRELKTLASVCPELNMANYTEDDVRRLNDWAIEMSLLVEQYALSQQPNNTACKSVQKRLAAQQPATGIEIDFKQTTELLEMFGGEPATVTLMPGDGHRGKGLYAYYTDLPEEGAEFLGEADDEAVPDQQPATTEPVKAAPYNPTEEMRWAMKRIDPALSSEQCRALWSAAWSAAPSTHPAPSAAVTPEPVEYGIRNAEDELNCAEEVLDAITCEFSDGEFPVTDFNCIGDYITAVVDVFKERLAAQQPATGIEIDFKQTTELLEMFGGEPATVTLMPGDGHRGKGLYAYYTDLPEEGAEFLGEADDEAVPDQQPATTEPVVPDSSEHLRVIASLGAALRRLSFAAQTTGETDGPDAELQSAIGQAEQALSLGGIWQAMSATGEPVAWLNEMLTDTRETFDADGGETPQVVRDVIEYVASWVTVYSEKNHPAPSVPDDVVRLRNALILAANRLDRLTLELKYDSQARADATEWASDAMLAAK